MADASSAEEKPRPVECCPPTAAPTPFAPVLPIITKLALVTSGPGGCERDAAYGLCSEVVRSHHLGARGAQAGAPLRGIHGVVLFQISDVFAPAAAELSGLTSISSIVC